MTVDLSQVLAHQPDVAQALSTVRSVAASTNDPRLLALAEVRISELLGVDPSTLSKQTASQVQTTERGRIVVAFVEQWVIDVASMNDAMVAAVSDELGDDGLMDFIHGMLAVEQRVRLELAWHRLGL